MSRRGLEKFMFRFDKDAELQQALATDPAKAFAGFELDEAERAALAACDVPALYRWGLHPLLIRNYAAMRKVDYVAAYKAAGIEM